MAIGFWPKDELNLPNQPLRAHDHTGIRPERTRPRDETPCQCADDRRRFAGKGLSMNAMKFSCPHCQQHIECDASHVGRDVPCPTCHSTLRVPTPSAVTPGQLPSAKWVAAPKLPVVSGLPKPQETGGPPVGLAWRNLAATDRASGLLAAGAGTGLPCDTGFDGGGAGVGLVPFLDFGDDEVDFIGR